MILVKGIDSEAKQLLRNYKPGMNTRYFNGNAAQRRKSDIGS